MEAREESLLFSFPQTGGTTPVARWAHAAAAVGSLLFTYGGVGGVVLDDLAVLDVDLLTWRSLKPRAAAPRDRPGKLHAAAMAATGSTVWLHGGQQGRRFLRELYALNTDAMAWALAAPAGAAPAARAGHAIAAVDGVGVFLFGGQGKKLFDDLHLLIVHGWSGPAAAAEAAAAGGGGGASGSGASSFSSARAARASGAGRDADASSVCSAGSASSSGAASGGGGLSGPLSSFGGGGGGGTTAPSCEWVEVKPRGGRAPSARRGHSLTWDGRDSLVLFGGSTSSTTDGSVWVYSISGREWFEISTRGMVPPPRTHHSAVLLRPGQLLVFGGCNAQGVFFQDAYLLDLATHTWCRPAALGPLPAARYHHSCTRVGRRTVIYGGINPRQAFDGVVLVESGSGLGSELSAVADELCRMSVSSAASDGGGSSAVGFSAGVSTYGPGGSVHGSSLYGSALTAATAAMAASAAGRTPSAPASLAGAGGDAPCFAGAAYAAAAAADAAGAAVLPPVGPAGAVPPPAAPSAVGSVGGASGVSGDIMRLQLRELLVKRHLEDLQLTSARKAEELIDALETERRAKASADRELMQARLMCAEAEERAAKLRARADEAAARAARDAAEAEAARAAAAEAAAARTALEQRLSEAHELLNSVSRELGLLSSRHHRLRLEHAAAQRALERAQCTQRAAAASPSAAAAGGAEAGVGGGGRSARTSEDSNCSGGGAFSGGEDDTAPIPGDLGIAPPSPPAAMPLADAQTGGSGGSQSAAVAACAHGRPPSACVLCAVQAYLSATQRLLEADSTAAQHQPLTAPSAAAPSSPSAAAAAAAAGAAGEVTGSPAAAASAALLRAQLAEARAALTASEAARAAAERAAAARAAAAEAAAADAAELRAALARLGGDRLALAACGAAELRELEARIDAAGRAVRELVVERTVSELQRRASSAVAEGALCGLCMERRKGLVFQCGHQVCVECGGQLQECAYCRAEITTKIKLWQS